MTRISTLSHWLTATLTAALAASLAACGTSADDEDESLLDEVPANARVVATGSLYDCAAMVGARVSGGELRGGEALDQLRQAAPRLIEPLEALTRWNRHADLGRVAVFADSATGELIATAMRLDEETPELDSEGEDLDTEHLSGATLYQSGGAWTVVTPTRLWAGNLTRPAGKKGRKGKPQFSSAALDSALAASRRAPISRAPGSGPFLSDAEALRLAIDMRAVPMPSGEAAATALVLPRAEGQSISARVTYVNATGHKVDPFSRLAPIDENVYSYFPAATAATAAVGADRHTLRSMLSHYGRALPMRVRAALEVASGYLCDSAATTAVAVIPGGSAETIRHFSLDTWTLLGLLPVEISRTEEFFELVGELTDDKAQCDIAGAYIAVSNGSLEDVATGDDPGEQLSDTRLRLQAIIPYNSELMRALGISRGVAIEVDCADGVTTARLTLLGADGKPASIFSALMGSMMK